MRWVRNDSEGWEGHGLPRSHEISVGLSTYSIEPSIETSRQKLEV